MLKVEMNTLKIIMRSRTSQSIEGSKKFIKTYIWYDNANHKFDNFRLYKNAIKNGIITFKEERITDGTTNDPLETNFERRSMNKLIEDRLEKNSSSRSIETKIYIIKAEYIKVKFSIQVFREVIITKAEVIRRLTWWDDSVDTTTIKAYLVNK